MISTRKMLYLISYIDEYNNLLMFDILTLDIVKCCIGSAVVAMKCAGMQFYGCNIILLDKNCDFSFCCEAQLFERNC